MSRPKWGITKEQLNDVVNFVSENMVSGIISGTGSGKSTNMIQSFYEQNSKVFVAEPTVPSAENLYRYMGQRLGTDKVGFAAEGNVQYNTNTKVVYCTSGHLRRKFLNYFEDGKVKDNKIDFCDVLVLDEAHNGSLDYDIIMELWNYALLQGAEIPRLVLASATISKESTIFENLPFYEIEMKGFPVEVEYSDEDYDPNSKTVLTDVANIVLKKHISDPVEKNKTSKWLVFCPGSTEVEKVVQFLKLGADDKLTVLPVYSKLQKEDIDKIFEIPDLGTRMVIVATNIAEASLTIDGLDGVFDTMLEKVQETSQSGGSRLVLQPISKSSADQRKGRTGRTNPGFCYRMISYEGYRRLKEQREREVFRVPLTNVVIEMMDIGLDPAEIFSGRILQRKIKDTFVSLKNLGMIDRKKKVTDKGHFAPEFPLSVYGSALIWEWSQLTKPDGSKYPLFPVVVVASLIDCFGPSPFFYPKKDYTQSESDYKRMTDEHYRKHFKMFEGNSDLEVLLNLWNTTSGNFTSIQPSKSDLAKWSIAHSLNNKKMVEIFSIVKQCCMSLLRMNYEVALGTFSEKNVIKVVTPLLEEVYSHNIFTYQVKSKSYFNEESREYYKMNTRGSLTPNTISLGKFPGKIVALSLAELPNKTGGPPTRLISLSQPI
jgi:HrpA-like RNA helicase